MLPARRDATHSSRPASQQDWNQFISRVWDPTTNEAPWPGPATLKQDSSKPSDHPRSFALAVKDNIATLGTEFPTTCASHLLKGFASPFEATIVTQLRKRGAVVIGKTNLDEFGMGSHNLFSHWGPVSASDPVNSASPSSVDPSSPISVGGSSGGSAAAVRLGDADVALGTDTGGSVRLPAAYGGIVGFKPSYGMLSRFGVVPYANSLDTVGLLAGEVVPIRQLILGNGQEGLWREADTERDPTSLTQKTRLRLAAQRSGYAEPCEPPADERTTSGPLQGLSFGVPLEYNITELDSRIREAWVTTAVLLRSLGATIAAVSLPSTRHALSSYYVLAPAEAASNLARYDGVRYGKMDLPETDSTAGSEESIDEAVLYERIRGAGLGREVQRRILLGAYALSSAARDNYFLQAQRVRRLVVRDFDAVFRLVNPLRDHDGEEGEGSSHHIDLSDLPEGLPLENKRGPAQVDFLLCPTTPTPAPRLADVMAAPSPVDAYINDVFTVPASLAGLPAISIPVPPSESSSSTAFCPGLQLIGQFWDDARLLRVAEVVMGKAFERQEDREALLRHRQTGVTETSRH